MPATDDTRPRILLVEDDALFAKGMRSLLANAGYEVQILASGNESALIGLAHNADLVILDLMLPGKDGFELLELLRATPETAHTPAIMLTAHDPMPYRLRGLALGADDFMIKPPNPQELLLRIRSVLRRAQDASHDAPRISVGKLGGTETLLDARSIAYVEAAHNYCFAYTRTGRHLMTDSISSVAEKLQGVLVRTHRCYLVNPAFVTGSHWTGRSEYFLELDLDEPTSVPVSRQRREEVRLALGL